MTDKLTETVERYEARPNAEQPWIWEVWDISHPAAGCNHFPILTVDTKGAAEDLHEGWARKIAAALTPAGEDEVERFADDVQDVQSRIIIVHQLRVSADIQDCQTKRETGWADTSDRATLMRKAADTIERLAALSRPNVDEVEQAGNALHQEARRLAGADGDDNCASDYDQSALNWVRNRRDQLARAALATLSRPNVDEQDIGALRYVLNFAGSNTHVSTVMRTFTLPDRMTTQQKLERLYAALNGSGNHG